MKNKGKVLLDSFFAMLMVMAMVIGLAQPASAVKAEDSGSGKQLVKVESFKASFVKGATLTDGKYVWTAKTDADDHRFTFRVDYSVSGVKELDPNAIKIRIPATILKDRSGKYADYTDMSIPSEDEYKVASDEDKKDVNYTWKYSDDKKYIVVTNVTERTAGENGYFEVSYLTNEQTFEYKDMGKSDPFKADIAVTNTDEQLGTQTDKAESDSIPVYINTTAEISSTDKRYPNKLYREWQSSWGTQPEETKGKYFLVWEIISKIKKDPTQPFTFTLKDTPVSKELHLIGYSMGSQSGPFAMDKNYVENQRNDNDRYDYVLTYYDPAEFKGKDYYELKNSVKATVTPEDKIDDPTHAVSSRTWEWDNPRFQTPGRYFHGEKYGDSNWYARFGYYHDYSSYSLDQLQEKKTDSLDTFRYYIRALGYPSTYTVDGDTGNPSDYWKKNVTYSLSDDELYLEDSIKSTGVEDQYTVPENAHQLDKDDYLFRYADWNVSSEFRKYDDEDKKFVTDSDAGYTSSDVVHFWVKKNGADKYTEVATYNLGTGKVKILDSDAVDSLTRKRITFKESANVTGIKFTTSNAYYYTEIEAYPMVKLKRSDYVMTRLFKNGNPENTSEDNIKYLVRLHDFSVINQRRKPHGLPWG